MTAAVLSSKTRTGGTRKKSRARKVLERPVALGWKTSDEDEISLRRWRGITEIVGIEALEPDQSLFGTFRVRSGSGTAYEVEIRDLSGLTNSCGCIDHRVSGLGTCKHIEGVRAALRRKGVRAFKQAAIDGSPRVEVFLSRAGEPLPAISGPAVPDPAVRAWLAPFLDPNGALSVNPATIDALLQAWAVAPDDLRRHLRVSRHFCPWLDRLRRQLSRQDSRAAFLAEVEAGTARFDLLKHPLLPYQKDGMLHLAFGQRALLADEMGLGKTVQAIAACELLAVRQGIGRVLVVCPASVKAEWEDQIAKFTDRPSLFVVGPRAQRLAAYGAPAFFTIVNYEQVLNDADAINRILAPDVVILDEAQRIKNWQTKTARQVKSLRSVYAFVLTGTPVENRIDEAYSIVQYLDPEIFGSLFRFNREFYRLDERGRPEDYQNLEELHHRLGPVMLRRRKADVEGQLPGRTVKTFFVPMADEQRARYEDYRVPAARLMHQARKRPLTKQEFDRLMQLLACMRMVCDTPAILDPTCRISPKLEELEGVLSDLLAEPDRKIIVFSEWERMLELVRELAGELGVDCAWHTGSVPQLRRRAEIARFKGDPACRLLLSTDSGAVGLNLQVASAVINVDLPWNPAKLEQRIARAWRKNQMRAVAVINLVTENSIEHGILHLLGQKQALADGVLDGQGDLAGLKMPSGRAAMVERMQAMMEASERVKVRILTPEERLVEQMRDRLGARLLLVEARNAGDGRPHLLAVVDGDGETLAAERAVLAGREGGPPVELIDRVTWETMHRLATAGLVQIAPGSVRPLHRAENFAVDGAVPSETATRVADLLAQADRARRMAAVLAAGGFPEEAAPHLAKSLGLAGAATLAGRGALAADVTVATPEQIRDLAETGALPAEAVTTLLGLWPGSEGNTVDAMLRLAEATARVVEAADRSSRAAA
ncbi:MAG: DEAD/DEAH box helicase [Azospirillaceae bacterium]|nr:DEAD/DEAH box helicase [Azospirillaceae bacterium]